MTAPKCCYFFLIAFFCLIWHSVSSYQKIFTSSKSLKSTTPVQTTLSLENQFLIKSGAKLQNFIGFNDLISSLNSTEFTDDCGEGTAGVPEANGDHISANSRVINPELAYDQDPASYSTLYIDFQQKDVEIVETISFSSTAYPSDIVKLTLSLGGALLNSNDYTVKAQAYNDSTPVGTVQNITSSLTVLPNTTVYSFSPGVLFNKVRISVIANQNGNKKAELNVHYVTLTPAPPSNTAGGVGGTSTVSVCEDNIILSVSNPVSGLEYRWYNSSDVLVYSSTTPSYSPLNLSPGSYVYYVSAARTGCTIESAKDQINLNVNPKPVTPVIALTN